MLKLFKTAIFSLGLATLGLAVSENSARASWIPIIDDIHHCVHGGCDPGKTLNQYKFSIYNRTVNSIHYSIDGKPELLSSGKGYTYTYKQLSKPVIRFDGSYRDGYQPREYSLANGVFDFQKVSDTELDLYRR